MDDLLPDLPMLEQLPYTYDSTELLPFNNDIDGLQGHDKAQSEIEEGISQVIAQRLLEADDDEGTSQILAQRLLEANNDEE